MREQDAAQNERANATNKPAHADTQSLVSAFMTIYLSRNRRELIARRVELQRNAVHSASMIGNATTVHAYRDLFQWQLRGDDLKNVFFFVVTQLVRFVHDKNVERDLKYRRR